MSETVEGDLTRLLRREPRRAANHVSFARRTSTDTEGEVSRVLRKLEASGQNYTILQLLANATTLFRPFILLSDALNNHSQIPADVREAVILRVAVITEAEYEWAEHVPMARVAGLSDEQIEALHADHPREDLFSDAQRLALDATEELSSGNGIATDTWQRICREWGQSGALELVAIAAWWGGFVQTVLAALGLVYPDDGRPGRRRPS